MSVPYLPAIRMRPSHWSATSYANESSLPDQLNCVRPAVPNAGVDLAGRREAHGRHTELRIAAGLERGRANDDDSRLPGDILECKRVGALGIQLRGNAGSGNPAAAERGVERAVHLVPQHIPVVATALRTVGRIAVPCHHQLSVRLRNHPCARAKHRGQTRGDQPRPAEVAIWRAAHPPRAKRARRLPRRRGPSANQDCANGYCRKQEAAKPTSNDRHITSNRRGGALLTWLAITTNRRTDKKEVPDVVEVLHRARVTASLGSSLPVQPRCETYSRDRRSRIAARSAEAGPCPRVHATLDRAGSFRPYRPGAPRPTTVTCPPSGTSLVVCPAG